MRITIKNYRCFVRPATFDFSQGDVAFVGINNAGKSTIMRLLLELRQLFSMIGANHNFVSSLLNPTGNLNPIHVVDPQEIFSNLNGDGLELTLDFSSEVASSSDAITKAVIRIARDLNWITELYTSAGLIRSGGRSGATFQPNNMIDIPDAGRFNIDQLFVSAQKLASTLYVGPFRNTINVGTKTNYLDINIGESFIKQFRSLKAGDLKRDAVNIQKLTDDIRKIFEFDTLDIVPSADDTSLHITVNQKPYKQHELGSGLSQFIVVLANASMKRPQYILIDEPELNLHPRLQLDFLTTLGSYASEGVWFSTHSIGLARAAADRVYSVIKEGDGDSIVRPLEGTPRLSEFLGEMSFSSHKELGFDKILLVEGPTEVKTIQRFLREMSKDHTIVLLPIYGHMPQAEELDEVLRISTRVVALIDSERTSAGAPLEPKRQEFLSLCASRNITAHALDYRATENYFTDSAVKQAFGPTYRALGPYERHQDAVPHWNKTQNWKIAAMMSLDDIRNTDLASFLGAL